MIIWIHMEMNILLVEKRLIMATKLIRMRQKEQEWMKMVTLLPGVRV
jgi:hypothetical protein